jgi:diguanylate cyclase (GGDEF)-like protein/PAS domain S-box-containing protein
MTTSADTPLDLAASALNLLDCGVIVLDAEHRILLWNRWMTTRSGRSAARVREQSLFDVFAELRGSRVEAAVLAALVEGTAKTVSQGLERSPFPLREAGSFDGARVEQAVSVSPLREGGAQLCMIEIRDVSGTIDRERQLLEHAESLRARSYVDGLTGIHNRRYFDMTLDRELRRAQRSGAALSLLLMDIDSFKAYNDHFGHQQGDACLTTVAQGLAGMLKRPGDVAARYGGEEFAAILPDTTAGQAAGVAEAIRLDIVGRALAHAPAAIRDHVTLSIGVASFSKEGLNEAALLIEAADKALYAAKRGGRDRVVVDGAADVTGQSAR